MTLISEAAAFADSAHSKHGHFNAFTNDPHIVHLAEVAVIVDSVQHTDEMIAAAWLHEVVKCPGITFQIIHDRFGHQVATYVKELNTIPYELVGDKDWVQNSASLRMISSSSVGAKTIKLADIISDTHTMLHLCQDGDAANATLLKSLAMLDSLKGGDHKLWNMANSTLHQELQNLSEKLILFGRHSA